MTESWVNKNIPSLIHTDPNNKICKCFKWIINLLQASKFGHNCMSRCVDSLIDRFLIVNLNYSSENLIQIEKKIKILALLYLINNEIETSI